MFTELNETTNNITWARITNGCIVVRSNEDDTKAKSRVNKAGNTVHERFYKSIAGHITSLNIEENNFGETEIKVGIQNGDNIAVLSFNYDSAYGRGFLNQIFWVDLTKQVEFTPWLKELEDGSRRTNLYLNYGKKQSVEYKLPEGAPEIKWVETKKGKIIDSVSKVLFDEYMIDKLNDFIIKNNLVYQKTEQEKLQEPLNVDELKELKKMKENKNKVIQEALEIDDLFDNM
jgi:hypothetical protein